MCTLAVILGLGTVTGNPWVRNPDPDPYPREPVPAPRVWVLTGLGPGFTGSVPVARVRVHAGRGMGYSGVTHCKLRKSTTRLLKIFYPSLLSTPLLRLPATLVKQPLP
jgi:hypothetical protein